MKAERIPEATVTRLSVYSRHLQQLENNGIARVSSQEIAELVDGSSAQVRKDLAYFGEFGTRGVGYDVRLLNRNLMKILGLEKGRTAIIVGAGRLGKALTLYNGFEQRGFNIMGIFDKDMSKVGGQVGKLTVSPMYKLDEFVKSNNIQIGVITVPGFAAQETVDMLTRAGVKAVLNFAPVSVVVPPDIRCRNVDLAVNMEVLSFYMGIEESKEAKKSGAKKN
ncbi:MAG: redox-sensing transcriptional repressor Rex [Clostridiales bacterium]